MEKDSILLERLAGKFTVDDGCWEWTAGKNTNGYGMFWNVDKKQMDMAYRVVYQLFNDALPARGEFDLDHLCRNTSCVNPGHLELVTHRVNMLRGNTMAAKWNRQNHPECVCGEINARNCSLHGTI